MHVYDIDSIVKPEISRKTLSARHNIKAAHGVAALHGAHHAGQYNYKGAGKKGADSYSPKKNKGDKQDGALSIERAYASAICPEDLA